MRFGFALQLCALRYPGGLLTPGEVIPLSGMDLGTARPFKWLA
jgi:hypothetical protein